MDSLILTHLDPDLIQWPNLSVSAKRQDLTVNLHSLNCFLFLNFLESETKQQQIEPRLPTNSMTQRVVENEGNGSIETLRENDESNNHNLSPKLILSDSMIKPMYNLGVLLPPDDD